MKELADTTILVTGASGFLGSNLVRRMLDNDIVPRLTMYRSHPGFAECDTYALDLTDEKELHRLLHELQPGIIIHCAAHTQTALAEKQRETTRGINVTATSNLLQAAPQARFIYLSTDLVFDGLNPPYAEDDKPNPRNWYAETKLAGEHEVRLHSGNFAIVRAALIYGEKQPKASNDCFLGWMHRGFREGNVTLFTDEYRTPIYVGDLCELILRLARSDFRGTLHAGGPERISRYDFGLKFCEVFGYSTDTIQPAKLADKPTIAYRPPDVSFDCSAAQRIAAFTPCHVAKGLQRTKVAVDS